MSILRSYEHIPGKSVYKVDSSCLLSAHYLSTKWTKPVYKVDNIIIRDIYLISIFDIHKQVNLLLTSFFFNEFQE